MAAEAWWAGKGTSLIWSAFGIWDTITGSIVWSIGFAAVGVALGSLIRNLAAAIAAALAWIALVEGVVAQVLGNSLGKWLPFNAGRGPRCIGQQRVERPVVPVGWRAGIDRLRISTC